MPFALIGFVLGFQYLQNNHLYFTKNNFNFYLLSSKLLLVVICMVTARSAAMAFNRYLDYKFDAKNPRTSIREIPSGTIKPFNALVFTVACCFAFIATCFFINKLCFYLSFVALFVILFYSYTKRFTALCHLVLGLGLSLAPIGSYLAITGVFQIIPLMFSFIVMCWVSGFDIIYALQDEEFDKSNQLHSIPVLLGKKNALIVSSILHSIAIIIVIYAGVSMHSSYWFWTGTAVFCAMLLYQHSIVKPEDLSKVNIAFMTANGIASVVFSIFVIIDLLVNK